MLCYKRIDVSEGFNFNTTNESKECDIFHYWYILDKGFKFQPDVWDRCHDVLMMLCHDLLMMVINHSNIAILKVNGDDYCCIISGTSKSEVINLLPNTDLKEKSRIL